MALALNRRGRRQRARGPLGVLDDSAEAIGQRVPAADRAELLGATRQLGTGEDALALRKPVVEGRASQPDPCA